MCPVNAGECFTPAVAALKDANSAATSCRCAGARVARALHPATYNTPLAQMAQRTIQLNPVVRHTRVPCHIPRVTAQQGRQWPATQRRSELRGASPVYTDSVVVMSTMEVKDEVGAAPTLTGLHATSSQLLHAVWSLQHKLAGPEYAQYQRLVSAYPDVRPPAAWVAAPNSQQHRSARHPAWRALRAASAPAPACLDA